MSNQPDGIAGETLLSLIQRIERLEEDRANIGGDIREVYREAKGVGFDTKTIRKIVALRKMEASDRQEQEALLESYAAAIGMLVGTPLGDAAMRTFRPSRPSTPDERRSEELAAALAHAGSATV